MGKAVRNALESGIFEKGGGLVTAVYGAGNPPPIFVSPALKVIYAYVAGTGHIRCTLVASDGAKLKAIAFRAATTELGELLLSERSFPIHVAGRLVVDEWGKNRVPSLQIIDAAPVS